MGRSRLLTGRCAGQSGRARSRRVVAVGDGGAGLGAGAAAGAVRAGAGALRVRAARGELAGAGPRVPGHVRPEPLRQLLQGLHLQVGPWLWLGGRSLGETQRLQSAQQLIWHRLLHPTDIAGLLSQHPGGRHPGGHLRGLHCRLALPGLHPLLRAPRLLPGVRHHLPAQRRSPPPQLQASGLPEREWAAPRQAQGAVSVAGGAPAQPPPGTSVAIINPVCIAARGPSSPVPCPLPAKPDQTLGPSPFKHKLRSFLA